MARLKRPRGQSVAAALAQLGSTTPQGSYARAEPTTAARVRQLTAPMLELVARTALLDPMVPAQQRTRMALDVLHLGASLDEQERRAKDSEALAAYYAGAKDGAGEQTAKGDGVPRTDAEIAAAEREIERLSRLRRKAFDERKQAFQKRMHKDQQR